MGRDSALLRLAGAGSFLCACAAVNAGCMAEHSCSDVYYACDQTTITVHSPSNAWSLGRYTLAIDADGRPTTCTLDMPTSAPLSGTGGYCGLESPVTFMVFPMTSCSPTACNQTACEGTTCTPVPGQYEFSIGLPGQPSHVALSLSFGGKSLLDETLTPQVATTEPNGKGCGTCVNASATVSTTGM